MLISACGSAATSRVMNFSLLTTDSFGSNSRNYCCTRENMCSHGHTFLTGLDLFMKKCI